MEEHIVVTNEYVIMVTVVTSKNYIFIKNTTKYRCFSSFSTNLKIILSARMNA